MTNLNLCEVFVSIQGEGPYIGTKQIFVRLAGCNLACNYCDTAWSWDIPDTFDVELDGFQKQYANPAHPILIAEDIIKHMPTNTYAVSVTGGEPLLQAEALQSFLPIIQAKTKTLLETNGTLPAQLSKVLPWVDIISMDIKLPAFSGKDLLKEHYEFLRLSASKEVYVKMVISEDTAKKDLLSAVEMVAKVSPTITLVIQPLAGTTADYSFSTEKLYNIQGEMLKILNDVRIIPQMHKLLNIK